MHTVGIVHTANIKLAKAMLGDLLPTLIQPFCLYCAGPSQPFVIQHCLTLESRDSDSAASNPKDNKKTWRRAANSAAAREVARAAQDDVWPSLQSHNETKVIRYTFVNLPPVPCQINTCVAPQKTRCGTASVQCQVKNNARINQKTRTAPHIIKPFLQMPHFGCTKDNDDNLYSRSNLMINQFCTQLLVCVRPEDECVSAFLGLVEKCLNHEAFTAAHARRLLSWKQQIIRVWHPLPPKNKDIRHNRRWSQQYGGEAFLGGGSFRMGRGSCGSGLGGLGGSSVQRGYPQIPPALLLGATKAFQSPQPHPLFSFSHNGQGLGNLMAQRNSL
ncbi:unnamed protein product, partial [Meganyctiphanes norvegica]